PRTLAFRAIGNPAAEFSEKRAGMEMLAYPRNRVGSIRHISCPSLAEICGPQPIGIVRLLEVARHAEWALLKPERMLQFQATARHSIGRRRRELCARPRPFRHEKTNPAQRLRHELRGASIARAV